MCCDHTQNIWLYIAGSQFCIDCNVLSRMGMNIVESLNLWKSKRCCWSSEFKLGLGSNQRVIICNIPIVIFNPWPQNPVSYQNTVVLYFFLINGQSCFIIPTWACFVLCNTYIKHIIADMIQTRCGNNLLLVTYPKLGTLVMSLIHYSSNTLTDHISWHKHFCKLILYCILHPKTLLLTCD